MNPAAITSVAPRPVSPQTGVSSPYRLIVRNAAGGVLSDQPMIDNPVHIDYRPYSQMLEGDAPVSGAAEIEITSGGSVLAARKASAHAPVVRVITPHRGAHVGGDARPVTVRWQATDADHDPLLVSLDYSGDGGHTWKTVFTGPNRGRANLPAYFLTHSRDARVRVRANDGFLETAALSGRFVSLGAAPLVSILSPQPRQRISNDASLYLRGTAINDAGRFLKGRRLRWYANRRLLGSGNSISVTALPPRTDRITLQARDSIGRTGSATVRIRVVAQAPRFLTLHAQPRISSKARSIRLTITVSLPAVLTIGPHAYRVNRMPRTIVVGIKPGKRPLVLRLRLSAFGRTSTTVLTIARR